ncbi:MAG TPA: BTAD domain-containing putative transcriptional regulator [Candidatus Limnocylindrales bacterium]|nr:BTAD domain-containing putative transcriptional regulator [Candidatus Limnocylindrales bacterium]
MELVVDGTAVALRPAQRRLLSILLLDPGGTLDRDALLDRMWGEAVPPTGSVALGVHLSGIRRAAPGLVVTASSGYRADVSEYQLDRSVFEHLAARAAAEAEDRAWDRTLRTASRGLALWRGTPYEALRDDDYATPKIARLVAIREELVDLRVRALLEIDRTGDAIVELEELVRQHPLRESLWELLILAMYRAGRQAEALRAFQEVRGILAVELGVEPGARLRRLEGRIVAGDETLGEATPNAAASNLPVVLTSFVGREDDLRGVARLLATHRLVTIVGGPGLGKTRLAIEAGHAELPDRRDGAWFVRLADARSTGDVIGAIAGAVGIRSQTMSFTALADRLAGRESLLILDNCEHLAGACAEFCRAVLARRGSIRILATSRRAVGLPDEAVWRLGPLGVPPDRDRGLDAGSALASPAIRLFVDRARAADRGYRLTDASAPVVATLCRRADGIPLALELAAAWVPALGPADIEPMLSGDQGPADAGRRTGGPGHHRSLDAAIEWSLALLAPEDRDLLHAAAVFRGAFALDDVIAVCSVADERRRVAASIRRLVEASLLVADRRVDGSVRYRMLVPIRAFARERLEQHPMWAGIRDRFMDHFLGKAWGPGSDLFRAVVDLASIDDDLDNLREAFHLALATGRADDVVRAIVPLDGYFLNRYLAREEREWLARALPGVRDAATRAHGLLSAALAAQATNELDEALRLLDAALGDFRILDDPVGVARCLLSLAGLHSNRGEWEAGLAAAREGRALATSLDNPSSLGVASHYIATNLAYAGRIDEGLAELEIAAGHFRRSGELGRVSHCLSTYAFVATHAGDEMLARRTAGEAVDLARRSGSEVRVVRALAAAAGVEGRWGDDAEAARLLAEVDDRMQAEANEAIFELLFPAGFLLRRRRRWDALADLVRAAEAAIAATGQGYPAPWRATAAEWIRDATKGQADEWGDAPRRKEGRGRGTAEGALGRRQAPRSVAAVRRDIRALCLATSVLNDS